ncbi:DUF3007 family protein [Thermosynechococcaceae cyanobacterium BACA0444]|uniref:DUF3007 family protein n=1 Tax=Pseudocalidococcus azoricus BACA0444 TaxID=2918990 RepID=A0AAE4FUS0_9CYAN|nr:DUF3007 family protein [Pseudocalidococcus azoricus]MDS3861235.1 DUF3007 family protein [Pseudocalidococcus azoricus BACA0444]
MRRIDAIALGLAAVIMGAVIYGVLQLFGLDAQTAGVWSQAIFVIGLLAWLSTYFFRVFTKQMTYNQQLKDYEDAVLEKRLESLTPEELAQLQAEIEADSSDA